MPPEFPLAELARVGEALRHIAIVGKRFGETLLPVLVRKEKAGVAHIERIKHPLLFECVERFAGNHLDDAPDHIERVAIFPKGAGLMRQRQRRQPLHQFGIVKFSIAHTRSAQPLLHQGVADIFEGETGRMSQQMVN